MESLEGGRLSIILCETLGLTSIAIALGLACALATSRLVAKMLYGVSAWDPMTLAAVSVVLSAVAAVAGWIPAPGHTRRTDRRSAL
jgi:putative ABC transport system permease protein